MSKYPRCQSCTSRGSVPESAACAFADELLIHQRLVGAARDWQRRLPTGRLRAVVTLIVLFRVYSAFAVAQSFDKGSESLAEVLAFWAEGAPEGELSVVANENFFVLFDISDNLDINFVWTCRVYPYFGVGAPFAGVVNVRSQSVDVCPIPLGIPEPIIGDEILQPFLVGIRKRIVAAVRHFAKLAEPHAQIFSLSVAQLQPFLLGRPLAFPPLHARE